MGVLEKSIFDVCDADSYEDGTTYRVPETACKVVVRVAKGPVLVDVEVHAAGGMDPHLTEMAKAFVMMRPIRARTLHELGLEVQRLAGQVGDS